MHIQVLVDGHQRIDADVTGNEASIITDGISLHIKTKTPSIPKHPRFPRAPLYDVERQYSDE